MRRCLILLSFIFFLLIQLRAQNCTNTGQTPSSAIFICNNGVYGQDLIPLCGQNIIPTPCNDGFIYRDNNPFWYRMACNASGTFGFTIIPNDLNDNYDWQLFDKTGKNPVDVFTDPQMFVGCNWSSDPGETGASSVGTNPEVCSGGGQPLFSKMPNLIAGREYLLLISLRSGSQAGFQLVIDGGTASITDPIPPRIVSAYPSCDGSRVIVKLNRGVRCNSLAADGSDFTVSGATVTSAYSSACSSRPTTDSIVLTLSTQLPNGNYTVNMATGTDNNTLIDICDRGIPEGQAVNFIVSPLLPTPLDSVAIPGCAPNTLQLFFRRPIDCSSIASNGSDFVVTGPQPVVITSVSSSCNAVPNPSNPIIIELQLASSIITGGTYQVSLASGTDGNTLIDECGRITPAGSAVSFTIQAQVSADFSYIISPSCKKDTIRFFHDGAGAVNDWNWKFDNTVTSNLQNPVQIYNASGSHIVQLIVSNGSCRDTVTKDIVLDNEVIASFDSPAMVCPGDTIRFMNQSTGNIESWRWDFGNGKQSDLQQPPIQQFFSSGRDMFYNVRLIASNLIMNCRDTATRVLRVLGNCIIEVPGAFTPNGDGLNDFLYPMNAIKADHLVFRVFNRAGQMVFFTRDWTRKWDGRINGAVQTTGLYAWTLEYVHKDTGKKVFRSGTSLLIK